jgi:acyl-CoA synthetase (AMP-forming)/AMP-acid ligase II
VFDSLPVKEFCVFATNYVWAKKELGGESLVLVLRLDTNQKFTAALRDDIAARNRQLPDFKRVGGYVLAPKDFPRNTALKIKRKELAEELANTVERSAMVML